MEKKLWADCFAQLEAVRKELREERGALGETRTQLALCREELGRAQEQLNRRELDIGSEGTLADVSARVNGLMAAAQELPPQVKGVLADCGYTNARDIIKKVIKQIGLPANLLYPLVRLGAMVYGGFGPNEADAAAAAANSRLPIIFYHGDTDDFVPCEMSHINYEACTAPKRLVIIPGAGHGLCYPVDPDGYVAALKEFNAQYTEN